MHFRQLFGEPNNNTPDNMRRVAMRLAEEAKLEAQEKELASVLMGDWLSDDGKLKLKFNRLHSLKLSEAGKTVAGDWIVSCKKEGVYTKPYLFTSFPAETVLGDFKEFMAGGFKIVLHGEEHLLLIDQFDISLHPKTYYLTKTAPAAA